MIIDGIDYIPLAEYANRVGVTPSNLRYKLTRGTLQGMKVGRDWMIPANAPYEDGRVKSGKYKDWRKKSFDKEEL